MDQITSTKAQGQRILEAREVSLLSRRAFGKKYGFNFSTLQAWEEGRYRKGIALESATKLSEAFAQENIVCKPEWILYGTGDRPQRTIAKPLLSMQHTKEDLLKELNFRVEIAEKNRELIQAIKANNAPKVSRLIAEGSNLHQLKGKELYIYNSREDTALHFAAAHAGETIISTFIRLGIHPNVRNRHVDAPLHIACLEGNLGAIESLIKHGANIESASREGATPLMWAAYIGNLKACELLIHQDVDLNNTDFLGNAAIHWASYNNQAATVELLYRKGAIPDVRNHDGKTPMDWALLNGNREALHALIGICQVK